MSTIATAPCRCRTCDRTATRGTPAAETSADPTLCPRCEHYRVMELAGLAGDYTGVDSPVFVEAAPAPAASKLHILARPIARRVACYALAALPADAEVSDGITADDAFGYLIDRIELRDRDEARRVEDVLRFAETPARPTTIREWAVSL